MQLEGDDLKTENQVVEDKSSVTSEHHSNEQMQAWVRGFGGEIAAPQTTRYLYQKYTGSNAGGAIGIHYTAADDFQVGIYANYGDLAMLLTTPTPALAPGVQMAGVVESPPITGKTPTTSRDYWEQQSSLATRTAPSSRLMALAEGRH